MTHAEKTITPRKRLIRFTEFFVVGLVMGISEDLMAIHFATAETITIHIVVIASIVSLPFAFFSELIVDHPDFWPHVLGKLKVETSQ
ncbi:MAG: hypothetical protein JSV90_03395 [Methanobacteriota archaeon]|nr:MAG: hypothetical protein JSV90_03395 [Euryarchaeota archaeon]